MTQIKKGVTNREEPKINFPPVLSEFSASLREICMGCDYRQMVFVSGPWQVGKTTISESIATTYLSWDDEDARKAIQSG